MRSVVHTQKNLSIVYDADCLAEPGETCFSVDFWRSEQRLTGQARGRGSAWFIDSPFGPIVLRHYLRGGWAAKLSRRSYFFTTVSRSRSFREFHLLEALFKSGLPVPRPVAALTEHHGFFSTGSLLTAQILSTQTLGDVVTGEGLAAGQPADVWRSVGLCIRRFHQAGVWHADLNARNILLDSSLQVFLIDFDRARYTPGEAVDGKGNLQRLKRSLEKLWPKELLPDLNPAWAQLEAGYHE